MLQRIPSESTVQIYIDNIPCMAVSGGFPRITVGIGTPLRFELYNREDIIKLKELCEFALKE